MMKGIEKIKNKMEKESEQRSERERPKINLGLKSLLFQIL